MSYRLIVAESERELRVHETDRYRVELITFYITPIGNIGNFNSAGGGLIDKDKLIATRIPFTSIKFRKGFKGEFPKFCCN